MLQLFHLDVANWCCTCCSGTHLSQQPAAVAGPTCMHVDAEGTQATSAGNGADTDRDVASRMRAQAREMERHRPPCEAGVGAGVRRAQWHA
jgi:hypothetical protein